MFSNWWSSYEIGSQLAVLSSLSKNWQQLAQIVAKK